MAATKFSSNLTQRVPLPTLPDNLRQPIALIWTLSTLLLALPLLAYSLIQLEGPRIRQEALADLNAISRLKANQIESWLQERRADAEALMANTDFQDDVDRWLNRNDSAARLRIANHLAVLQRAYGYQAELLDLRADPNRFEPGRRALLEAALVSGQPQLSDLYRGSDGQIWLDLLAPLGKPGDGRARPVGALLLRTPANAFLFPLIQSWPTDSPSAETLLIRRDGDDVLFLNDVRHGKSTALTLRMPLATADRAAPIVVRAGTAQTIEGRDYRAAMVLGAVHPIKDMSWLLAAKIDRDEVMRPLEIQAIRAGGVALFAVIAAAVTLLLFWRRQQRDHRRELNLRTGEKDRLLSLFYDLPFMGMAIVDPNDNHWLHVNERLCELLGYRREELLASTNWQQLTHPDDLAHSMAEHRRMLAGENNGYQMAERWIRKEGSPIDVALAVKCVRGDDGRVDYIVKTVRDISERKHLEQAMAEKHRATGMLEAVAAASSDAIFAKDAQGAYLFCNKATAIELRKSPPEVFGQNDLALFPPEVANRMIAQDREIMASGETRTFEEVFPDVEGERIFLTTKGPLVDGDGRRIGLYGIAHDITGRKRNEQELADSRARLAGIIDSAMDAIITLDGEQRVQLFNPAAEKMFGYTAEEMIGGSVDPLIPNRLREGHRQNLLRFVEEGVTRRRMAALGELHGVRRDGTEFPIEASISMAHIAGERLYTAIVRDVSERKQSEAALHASEQRFRNLFEQMSTLAVQGYDRQRRVIYWNDASEKLYGYSRAEALGRPLEELIIPPALRPGVIVAIADWLENGIDIPAQRLEMLCRDGRLVPVFSSHVMQWNSSGEPEMYCVDVDLRELDALQAALRASETRFQAMADAAPVLVWIAGPDRVCNWFNQQWLNFTGRSLVQEIGNGWVEGVHPEDRTHCLAVYNESFDLREPFEMEYRLQRADGQYRWMLSRGVPHFCATGEFHGYIGSGVDVTARKLADDARRVNEERLRLALSAANAGTWDWDIVTGKVVWSPENFALYGLDPADGMPTQEDWECCIHPDDLAAVKQAIAAVREGRTAEYHAEFRVHGPGFDERWLSGIGRIECAADGTQLRMTGINLNVTERKRIERVLWERGEDLNRAQAVAHIGSWRLDMRNNALSWSEEILRIFAIPAGTAMTYEIFLSCVHPDDRVAVEQAWQSNLRGEPCDIEHRLLVNGQVKWLRQRAELDCDGDGNPLSRSLTAPINSH